MQAVVKTPHIDINIKGDIPPQIISIIKQLYGNDAYIIEDDQDEFVDIFETDWYKKTKSEMNPGEYLKIYRENMGWTQKELGEKLGGVHYQNISNMENGTRNISLKMAKQLAQLFDISVERFIHQE